MCKTGDTGTHPPILAAKLDSLPKIHQKPLEPAEILHPPPVCAAGFLHENYCPRNPPPCIWYAAQSENMRKKKNVVTSPTPPGQPQEKQKIQ